MSDPKLDQPRPARHPLGMRAPLARLAIRGVAALFLVGMLAAAAAHAAPPLANTAVLSPPVPVRPLHPDKGTSTGLPVPRFISLRTGDVNMRVGPGFQYPIKWVYKRRGLPVEVQREFDVWRLVLAPDGGRGWVHEETVSGTRTFIVTGGDHLLRERPDDKSPALAVLKVGVIGAIRRCRTDDPWCAVKVDGRTGFLPRSDFWGTFPGEPVR
jgi:SH3-like domain-containing protein